MEAEESHKMPLSWRTRKASGIIQFESEGPRTRVADIWRQEKMDVPAQAKRVNLVPLEVIWHNVVFVAYNVNKFLYILPCLVLKKENIPCIK